MDVDIQEGWIEHLWVLLDDRLGAEQDDWLHYGLDEAGIRRLATSSREPTPGR